MVCLFRFTRRLRPFVSPVAALCTVCASITAPSFGAAVGHVYADRRTISSSVLKDTVDLAERRAANLPRRHSGYPLIANYNGFMLASDVPAYAYNALIVAKQDANLGSPSPLTLLRLADPGAVMLLYQRTLQVDYPLIHTMYGTTKIYPGWWLLRAGARLETPITATQHWIAVSDVSRFHVYDDVLVDGESMHVRAIIGHSLIVDRGFFSRASAHVAGSKIAAHYSYRVDLQNRIIRGAGENRRPWSFNLSSVCPRDAAGLTWADFLVRFMVNRIQGGGWDGAFFDNTDEAPRDTGVDVNNDNMPDGGSIGGVNVWRAGEIGMMTRFRQLLPHALIVDNGTLVTGPIANGREFENFPLAGQQYAAVMSDYLAWPEHLASPKLLLVNPDTQLRQNYDLRAMRFGLTSALMHEGYYAYDEGWHRHGAAWVFDEYDNGAGSALEGYVSATSRYLPVRRTNRFRIGDLLVVGREQMEVVDLGTWNLVVRRGVNGTVPATHVRGTVVATPAQLSAGSGYLGQPIGPETLAAVGARKAIKTGAGLRLRMFEHGVVLINPTSRAGTVRLPRWFWHLRGDQDPTVNNGMRVRTVHLLPYTGVILLNNPSP